MHAFWCICSPKAPRWSWSLGWQYITGPMERHWNFKKSFLCKHFTVKCTTFYSILLLETGCLPIEWKALLRVHQYLVKVTLMPEDQLPNILKTISSQPQKTLTSEFRSSSWMIDILTKWELDSYLERILIIPSSFKERCLIICMLNGDKKEKGKVNNYCPNINWDCWPLYEKRKW